MYMYVYNTCTLCFPEFTRQVCLFSENRNGPVLCAMGLAMWAEHCQLHRHHAGAFFNGTVGPSFWPQNLKNSSSTLPTHFNVVSGPAISVKTRTYLSLGRVLTLTIKSYLIPYFTIYFHLYFYVFPLHSPNSKQREIYEPRSVVTISLQAMSIRRNVSHGHHSYCPLCLGAIAVAGIAQPPSYHILHRPRKHWLITTHQLSRHLDHPEANRDLPSIASRVKVAYEVRQATSHELRPRGNLLNLPLLLFSQESLLGCHMLACGRQKRATCMR